MFTHSALGKGVCLSQQIIQTLLTLKLHFLTFKGERGVGDIQ